MRTIALLTAVVLSSSAHAQAKKEPLAERVKGGVEKGLKFLRASQRPDGGWETDLAATHIHGGWTSLATLALLNAGVAPKDPAVLKALEFLRKLDTSSVYVKSLQTMVFVEARQPEDKVRIDKNVRWLTDARVLEDGKLTGWSYDDKIKVITDNSNTHYALLALHYGSRAGVKIKRDVWDSIRDYYLTTQKEDGGWVYSAKTLDGGLGATSMTMTVAGLSGLLTAASADPKGGKADAEKQARDKAREWIEKHKSIDLPQRTFYHLHSLAHLGKLLGKEKIGAFEWYREGAEWLLEHQKADGSWHESGTWDQWPVVSTSFALLFLKR